MGFGSWFRASSHCLTQNVVQQADVLRNVLGMIGMKKWVELVKQGTGENRNGPGNQLLHSNYRVEIRYVFIVAYAECCRLCMVHYLTLWSVACI